MSNDLVVPDWLKSMVDDGQVQSDASNLISSASSVPRISLKGMSFRFIENGEEVRRESGNINVVILGVQPEAGMAKTWYRDNYSGESGPPECSSWDGVRPDSWVNEPQSEFCATCKWNKWGSAKSRTGKKAKACRDSKRLMVVDPRDIEKGTIYILNVTVASLKNLSNFGKELAIKKIPMEAVITQVSMDPDAEIPILHFNPIGVMKQETAMVSIQRSQKKEWNAAAMLPSSSSTGAPALTHDTSSDDDDDDTPAAPAVSAKPQTKASSPGDSDPEVDALLDNW